MPLRHCTHCDTEWVSSNINCWLCGREGTDGPIKNSNGQAFMWNGYPVRASEPIEEGMAFL